MSLEVLRDEITTDPLGRGYSGMNDADVAADLNTSYRVLNVESIAGSELMNNVDSAEFASLTDVKKAQWLALCGIDRVDPFGPAVQFVLDIWGAGSNTISNLQNARVEQATRAEELGLFLVTEGEVTAARNDNG